MLKYRNRTFGRDVKKSKASKPGGGGSNSFALKLERWRPTDIPIWVRIPFQEYTYLTYDRNDKKVIEVTRNWYEYKDHFIVNGATADKRPKRQGLSHICSNGADRSKPCWSCAFLDRWWEDYRLMRDMDKNSVKGLKAPCSAGPRFVMAVTLLENVYKFPLLDNKGQIRKTKGGTPIYTDVLEPHLDEAMDISNTPHTFGKKSHWSMGSNDLTVLSMTDDYLYNVCANCTTEMDSQILQCAHCGDKVELRSVQSGKKLADTLGKERKCGSCGVTDFFNAIHECECGDPKPGGIMFFDLLTSRAQISETSYQLSIDDIRIPLSHKDTDAMTENPYNVVQIFTPEDLSRQRKIWDPSLLEGLRADMAVKTDAGKEELEGEAYESDLEL